VVEGVVAHQKGDYAHAVDLLWPVRRDLHRIGGSHAQRDLFFQVLVDAAMRAGRATQVAILLDDIAGIGFEHVADRSLYREAAAMAPQR
jgi:hypothetical protein